LHPIILLAILSLPLQTTQELNMTFDEAVSYFGSAYKLARALGLNPQSIKGWDKQIPILRQYQIELATEGKLKADFPALVDIRYAPGFDPETTVTYVVARKKPGAGTGVGAGEGTEEGRRETEGARGFQFHLNEA
jgi:hypothetical protein